MTQPRQIRPLPFKWRPCLLAALSDGGTDHDKSRNGADDHHDDREYTQLADEMKKENTDHCKPGSHRQAALDYLTLGVLSGGAS